MFENIDTKKVVIMVVLIAIVFGGGIWLFIQYNESTEYIEFEDTFNEANNTVNEQLESNVVIEEKAKIVVDICGEVISPGVITLEEGARIIDAINLAGGATKEANLSKVNLAYILSDAQKIYIPSINEDISYISNGSGDNVIAMGLNTEDKDDTDELKININTADKKELQKLPGIGESISERIVQYRKENGKFRVIEDIKNVSGVGDSKFNNIKQYIYVK